MGRAPCCEKVGLKKGRWTAEEDQILVHYIKAHGEGSWRSLPKKAGLLRCGKSCRLRWINYLREDLKRGNISGEEEDTIIKLRATLGNRWSVIAGHLPGRTDNEIKNYWNSHLSKKVQESNQNKDEPNANRAAANSRKVGRPRGCKKKNSLKINSNKEKSERYSKKTPSDDKEVGMAIVSQTHEANNEILLMNEHDIINGNGVSVVNGVSSEEEREGGNCKSSSSGKKDDGGGEIEVFDEGVPLLEEIELVDWELEEIASRLWEEEGEVRPWILGDESEVFGGILEMGEFGLFKDAAWDNWLLPNVL